MDLLDLGMVGTQNYSNGNKNGSAFGTDDVMISLNAGNKKSTSRSYQDYIEEETDDKENSSLLGGPGSSATPATSNIYQAK